MLAQNLGEIQRGAGLPWIGRFQAPGEYIVKLLPYIFSLAGIILLFQALAAGYQMIFSRGEPKAMQIASSKLTTSIVGILIIFVSFWVVKIIGDFFDFPIFSQIFI